MNIRTHRRRRCGALLVLAVALPTATAEVSHRFVEIAIDPFNTHVDVDEDGVFDFEPTSHPSWWTLTLDGATWMNGFLASSWDGQALALSVGDSVGPVLEGGPLYYYQTLIFYWSSHRFDPYVMPLGERFFGIEFIRDGEPHHGWLRIAVASTGFEVPPISATITEIAWESQPATPIVVGWGDCNGNGTNDVVEILEGSLPDCNGDFVDDECQPDADCDGNGVRDLCELGSPGVPDCNQNLIPDPCEIAADPAIDCNADGVIDACLGALADCDGDGVHDPCQTIPASEDCDGDGLFDWCEIANAPALDCDGDGALDACQIAADPALDCNQDGVIDACLGELGDCDGNGVHDPCQAIPPSEDCNGNGLFDSCELSHYLAFDCDEDGVLDECQIAADPALDCDEDGALDACEVYWNPWLDCDGDGAIDVCQTVANPDLDCDGDHAIDTCQIAENPASDCDGDGVLDACQLPLPPEDDCDGDGVFDACQVVANPALDCNGDGVLDACQLPLPPDADCDGNGIFDACQPQQDCDGDGVFDACAIAAGIVDDCDGNGIPDVCQDQEAPFAGDASWLFLPGEGAGAVVPGYCNVLPTSEITIELWQWIEAPGPAATFWTHLEDFNRCLLHAPFTDGKVYWDFGFAVIPDGRLSYTPPEPIVGSWQHFALQASNAGEFMRIYRNGVLEAEKAGAETFNPNANPLRLGGTAWGQFQGRIDEVRVWNHIRTAGQIAQFIDGTIEPTTPGLVGYWRFDEGRGSVGENLVGPHDAVLNGSAEWRLALSCPPSPDIDGNGIVDGGDLGILLGAWGPAPPGSVADLNADGIVDGGDLGELLAQWG